jgi:TPR repeat protein
LETSLFWPDDIDVFDGDLPPEPVMPREPEVAPKPPPIAAAPAPPPPPPAPVPREDVAVKPAEPSQSRTPLLAGIGLLLLAVIGGAAWWFTSTPQPAPIATPAPTPPAAPAPPAPPPAPVTAERPWLERSDGMSLRDLVQSASDAAAIHAAALRRQAAGRHDDALVLFEEAGERGHAPALTAVARLYDPIGFVAGRPFRAPDPRAAARYYRDAVQKGDAAAAAPRAALKTWLEEQARAGNGTAESALKEFWQ